MKRKAKKALQALSHFALKADMWGVIDGCKNTQEELGTSYMHVFKGKWLYICTAGIPIDFTLGQEAHREWNATFGEPDEFAYCGAFDFMMFYKI